MSQNIIHEIFYYSDGKKYYETWRTNDDIKVLHRDFGPAYIEYLRNGQISLEKYYRYGEFHHHDGGHVIVMYHDNGMINQLYTNEYYNDSHKDIIYDPTNICYYENGSLKRVSWERNYYFHRLNGPSLIHYYDDGQCEFEGWYKNGSNHRLSGPAIINYRRDGSIDYCHYYANSVLIDRLVRNLFGDIPYQLTKEQQILLKLSIPTEYL